MATVSTNTQSAPAPLWRDRSARGGAWRRWLVARRTRAALSALPDRGLADLGIQRWEIDRVAREAARRS